MIIVGEKINSSRKSIAKAVDNKDAGFIQTIARQQADAGADYIDVNAGTFLDKEVDYLPWLVEVVQDVVDGPLCIDSPNPEAIKKALAVHQGVPMINSISLEKDRYDALLPLIKAQPCKIVALCMAKTAMPTTVEERVAVAEELIGRLTGEGIARENIFVDPLVQPVSVDVHMGPAILGAISEIMTRFPGVHTICGLSNISFGLPMRKMINRQFLGLAMGKGLDGAILDPTDVRLMATLMTVRMLSGQDEYCTAFIEAYETGVFKDEI